MLTLTPVVCMLSAIAFSNVFEHYLGDDMKRENPPIEDSSDEDGKSSGNLYDKVNKSCFTAIDFYVMNLPILIDSIERMVIITTMRDSPFYTLGLHEHRSVLVIKVCEVYCKLYLETCFL